MLLPFHPRHAQQIQNWNYFPEYHRFWRGIDRFLTLEECEHLPQVLGHEILMWDDVGMVALDQRVDIVKFGILVDRSKWKQGNSTLILSGVHDYCFGRKQCRIIQTECSEKDIASNRALEKQGFKKAGMIEKYILYNGVYENANLYYKLRP